MINSLLEIREYVASQYEILFNRPGWRFSEEADLPISGPVWLWQTRDLYRTSDVDSADGAAILDPDIGTCLFVLVYDPLTAIRQQILRALQLRSTLLPGRKKRGLDTDEWGAWRVVLYWLVEAKDLPQWISTVAEIREQTAHFEEIPVDAVVRETGSWKQAAELHAFPRLLFCIRATLQKKQSEIENWQNADRLVSDAISNLPNETTDPLAHQCAAEIVSYLRSIKERQATGETQPRGEPISLLRLRIENFRNIDRLELEFRDCGYQKLCPTRDSL